MKSKKRTSKLKPISDRRDILMLLEKTYDNALLTAGRPPKVIVTTRSLQLKLKQACLDLSKNPINNIHGGFNSGVSWHNVQVIAWEDILCIF